MTSIVDKEIPGLVGWKEGGSDFALPTANIIQEAFKSVEICGCYLNEIIVTQSNHNLMTLRLNGFFKELRTSFEPSSKLNYLKYVESPSKTFVYMLSGITGYNIQDSVDAVEVETRGGSEIIGGRAHTGITIEAEVRGIYNTFEELIADIVAEGY